jgi:hypothetical protein
VDIILMLISMLLISTMLTAFIYNYFLRHTTPGMAGSSPGNSLGRSWSLIDVSRASTTPSVGLSASATDVRIQPGTSTSTRGTVNVEKTIFRAADKDAVASEEQGLALLGEDAVYGESEGTGGTLVDNSILDYDSEGSDEASQTTDRTELHPLSTTMETDIEAAPEDPQELDAMYYQCRSARLAGRQDTFVSVTLDSSFGKIVTV